MNLEMEEPKAPFLTESSRPKSSLRIKYEAEVRVLKRQLGSLEEIRAQLGLSQRKMCQLLMVDPSAWTRWLKDEAKVPPHIYRSLQWYLELVEKRPEWHPQNSFHPQPQVSSSVKEPQWNVLQEEVSEQMRKMRHHSHELISQMQDLNSNWQSEKRALEEKVEKKDMALMTWKLIVLVNTCFILFWLAWQIL